MKRAATTSIGEQQQASGAPSPQVSALIERGFATRQAGELRVAASLHRQAVTHPDAPVPAHFNLGKVRQEVRQRVRRITVWPEGSTSMVMG
jgi:hypothetical protein